MTFLNYMYMYGQMTAVPTMVIVYLTPCTCRYLLKVKIKHVFQYVAIRYFLSSDHHKHLIVRLFLVLASAVGCLLNPVS